MNGVTNAAGPGAGAGIGVKGGHESTDGDDIDDYGIGTASMTGIGFNNTGEEGESASI